MPCLRFLVVPLVLFCGALSADEGMWTFDNPPLKQLKENYEFTPTAAWLIICGWLAREWAALPGRSSARTVCC